MQKYSYEAKDQSSGKTVKATLQAESENAAAKLLMSQGFIPHTISAVDDNDSAFSRLKNRITIKDKVVFTRQLATLIGAGLPLSQSLHTVKEQTENSRLKDVVQDITTSIEGGKSLSESFAKHPEVFDKIFLALVEAGEASGTLDEALRRVAAQQEKDAAIMGKIKGALTYPIIVLFVILGVIVFMLVTVVPQVEKLYEDLKKDLPFLTQLMVDAANLVINYWYLFIVGFGVLIYFTIQYSKTESGIKVLDGFKLNVPLFKGMFRKLYMARFARTGQTLLSTGVPMLDMLEISKGAVNNSLVGKDIADAAEKVKGGKSLSSSLAPGQYILPLVPQMISIGEQSGKIDDMMGKAAQVYEDELDAEIQTISTAIEPLLMVVLAIVAGGMVGAILLPIYSLVNTVQL
jgi:type IV pilus assembly protein PilC